ncbi:MAG: fasciclin domain-containing protein [Saprospiraceae bacterium]|nr:fasciclin domain-containing protein [Saprospiraceae bacterium]
MNVLAQDTKMVGGAAMYPTKTIMENAANSKDHTILVADVQAAVLVETLRSAGPFTVFAPVNAAFNNLPAGTVEVLLKPKNKAMLTGVLTYHVLSGKLDAKSVSEAIQKGKGNAVFTTVAGGKLTAVKKGKDILMTDENGGMSIITIADVYQANGLIHVIDSVLLPKSM